MVQLEDGTFEGVVYCSVLYIGSGGGYTRSTGDFPRDVMTACILCRQYFIYIPSFTEQEFLRRGNGACSGSLVKRHAIGHVADAPSVVQVGLRGKRNACVALPAGICRFNVLRPTGADSL